MTRFDPPPRPLPARRSRVGPVYSDGPDEAVPAEGQAPEIADAGWAAIRSRSRFGPPSGPITIGHGGLLSQGPGPAQPGDPAAGRTQFPVQDDPQHPAGGSALLHKDYPNLGDDDVRLAREGVLDYTRDLAVVPVAGYSPADPIRPGSYAIPTAFRSLTFLVRREFQQLAQSFSGLHVRITPGAKGSTSPVRMGPTRSSRLTVREIPGSYGEQTQVLQ